MNPKLHLSLLLLLYMAFPGQAQPYKGDSSMAALNTYYNQHLNESSILNSGPVYIVQTYLKAGSPFYNDIDAPIQGWIVYGGHYYSNIFLQWDVFKNYVITPSLNGFTRHILNNDLIDSFYFNGQLIRNLMADKDHNLQNGGLYVILYDGNVQAIVRALKDNIGIIEGMKVKYHFRIKNSYYIRYEGIYYKVNNKKDVLNLLHAYRTGIKREIKSEKLKWRKNFESCVRAAAEYSDKAKFIR